MTRKGKRGEAVGLHGNPKLFFKLADKRVFRRLVCLHLTAGKLPQSGHFLVRGAFGQENAAIDIDERHGDDQDERRHPFSFDSRR